MLKIRLQRVGRTNIPTFRVVLTDSKNSTKSGRFLEVLGSFDPRDDKAKLVKGDRVKYWISKGAQLSGTLHNFLVHTKVIEGKKINVLPKKRPIKSAPISDTGASGKAEDKGAEKAPETAPAVSAEAAPAAEVVAPAETPAAEVKA